MLKKISLLLFTFFVFANFTIAETIQQDKNKINLIIFEIKHCPHCANLGSFLSSEDFLSIYSEKVTIQKIDVQKKENVEKFRNFTEQHNISQITPITLVGNSIIIGFDSPRTTGENIKKNINQAIQAGKFNLSLNHYLAGIENKNKNEPALTCDETTQLCSINLPTEINNEIVVQTQDTFSFLGKEIDIKNMGLFSISIILGTLDGFNPCAMWVLFTLLIALSQIRNRKRMIQIAGLFILTEAVVYFLILNIWYQTWNFIKLDAIVTPIIGTLSVVAGMYFLWKYFKTKDKLVCDVTSAEHQAKISTKIKNLSQRPFTFAVALGVILLAASVNIIEFACSIGIAQTYTKILELNNLSFWAQQFYTAIYIFGYMLDNIIIFGLAIWGYKKFYAFGAKSTKYATLFAGISMIILGVILIFFKDFLVF